MSKFSTRRQFLTVIGLTQAGLGATYADPSLLTVPRQIAFQWIPFEWVSPYLLGWIMLASGLLCLVAVATSKITRHWARQVEKAAFGVATLPYTLLTLIFLGSGLVGGNYPSYFAAISYASLIALVVLAAGIVHTPDDSTGPIPVPPHEERLNE